MLVHELIRNSTWPSEPLTQMQMLVPGVSQKRENPRGASQARVRGKLPKYCEDGTTGGK
jgi:hypothetical protein